MTHPTPDPDSVSSAYDRWAPSYDTCDNPTRDLDAAVLRRSGPDVSGRDVLEAGCGTGKNTEWLAGRARSVVAMDFSAGMLQAARARVPDERVRWIRHDLREVWPVEGAAFDVVLVDLVLEHVRDLGPVFAEAARVLRSQGRLFVCELHPFRQWRGGQAHFDDAATGETIHVPACVHTLAEFVNTGLAAGLRLEHLGEWLEEDASPEALPRLLSLEFLKP